MKELVVYDNTIKPSEIIQDVIGDKGFGDVIVKKRNVVDYYEDSIKNILPNAHFVRVNNNYDINKLKIHLMDTDEEVKILHCLSNFIILDNENAALTYKKLPYIQENIKIYNNNNQIAAIMFYNRNQYISFLNDILKSKIEEALNNETYEKLSINGISCIGEINNFIQCITGNFDSRYFNSLQGTEYLIRKISSNKKKIKSEYKYYHLLPEKMQIWFVMPIDYQENNETASYAMERLHMTDIAIKWVHGSFKINEFNELMDMYFHFFEERCEKDISKDEYEKTSNELYISKVLERVEKLKQLEEYKKIENLLMNNTNLKSIDEIIDWYMKLKKKVEARVSYRNISVIGHGDPCFANALYNYSTRTLKFIDPKGALTEEELWTNPYYDIAKLSHSVCGRYDFFNNAMYDITIGEDFNYELTIPFDNSQYKEIFRKKVEEKGFDYWSVRVYEASLFLSMLPLHIDNPHKVFGFILNAIEILKEIEENV